MPNPPSAAAALYPHLKAGTPEPVQQRRKPNSVADALYPRPSRDQQLWDEICKRNREVLRRGLREAVANIERGNR